MNELKGYFAGLVILISVVILIQISNIEFSNLSVYVERTINDSYNRYLFKDQHFNNFTLTSSNASAEMNEQIVYQHLENDFKTIINQTLSTGASPTDEKIYIATSPKEKVSSLANEVSISETCYVTKAGSMATEGRLPQFIFNGEAVNLTNCAHYNICSTQIINGIWHSAKPELSPLGDSVGKDYRAFRAYYDDRLDNSKKIIVIGSATWNLAKVFNEDVYCIQWYSNGDMNSFKLQQSDTILRTGIMRLSGQYHYQIDIICPAVVHKGLNPKYISISFEPCTVAMKLPILYPPSQQNVKMNFAVCAPAIYDWISNKEALATVEWVELYRNFGVEKFYFYAAPNINFEPPLDKVMDYYTKLGIINITSMPPPVVNHQNVDGFTLSKSVSKNSFDDCLYRNINRFRYLINVDLDDMMIPRGFPTFQSLIESAIRNDSHKSDHSVFNTRSINYFLDYGPTVNSSDPLITSKYFGNSGYGTIRHKVKVKPIANSGLCRFMWNHGCQVPNTRTGAATLKLDTVVSHHFRRSCKASYKGPLGETKPDTRGRASPCDNNMSSPVIDNYAYRFRDFLLQKVGAIAKELQLDISNHY